MCSSWQLAAAAGFRVLYFTGAGVANASFGLPDLGMTTLEHVLEDARRITAATDLPLLVDCDTGWEQSASITNTVRKMIGISVAAIHLEDQAEPKRCGHRPGKRLARPEGKRSALAVLRRSIQVPSMLLVFACGILLSAALNHGSTRQNEGSAGPASLEPPTMSIESGRGRLVVRGMSKSTAHESGLLQLVADHFDGFDAQTSFSAGVVLTNNWDSASGRLLYTLAAMDSAQAVMRDGSISIRGVTSDAETFTTRLEFLRESLPAETLIDADVVTNEAANSASELCNRVFSRVTTGPVSFKQSSAEIRVAGLATLDRISEFAHNCQRATISITGHTDASGDESWNRQLSLARAQAVADHLTDRGVVAARLIVSGSGSAEPIADNTTAIGRERNRRIEFALR